MFCALNGIAQLGMFCFSYACSAFFCVRVGSTRESKSSLDTGYDISLRKSEAALQLNGIPETIRESIQEGCPEQDDKGTNWFTEWLDLFIKIAAAPVNSSDTNRVERLPTCQLPFLRISLARSRLTVTRDLWRLKKPEERLRLRDPW